MPEQRSAGTDHDPPSQERGESEKPGLGQQANPQVLRVRQAGKFPGDQVADLGQPEGIPGQVCLHEEPGVAESHPEHRVRGERAEPRFPVGDPLSEGDPVRQFVQHFVRVVRPDLREELDALEQTDHARVDAAVDARRSVQPRAARDQEAEDHHHAHLQHPAAANRGRVPSAATLQPCGRVPDADQTDDTEYHSEAGIRDARTRQRQDDQPPDGEGRFEPPGTPAGRPRGGAREHRRQPKWQVERHQLVAQPGRLEGQPTQPVGDRVARRDQAMQVDERLRHAFSSGHHDGGLHRRPQQHGDGADVDRAQCRPNAALLGRQQRGAQIETDGDPQRQQRTGLAAEHRNALEWQDALTEGDRRGEQRQAHEDQQRHNERGQLAPAQ